MTANTAGHMDVHAEQKYTTTSVIAKKAPPSGSFPADIHCPVPVTDYVMTKYLAAKIQQPPTSTITGQATPSTMKAVQVAARHQLCLLVH